MIGNQATSFLNIQSRDGVGDSLPYVSLGINHGKPIVQKPLNLIKTAMLQRPSLIPSLKNISEKTSAHSHGINYLGDGLYSQNKKNAAKSVTFSNMQQSEIMQNINDYLTSPGRKSPHPFLDREPAGYQRPRNIIIPSPAPPNPISNRNVSLHRMTNSPQPPNFNVPLPPPLIQYPMNSQNTNLSLINNNAVDNVNNMNNMPLQPQLIPPLQTQLMQTQPIQTQPMQIQPMQTQPMQNQPIQTQPMQTQLMQTQPMQTQPVQIQPIQTQPMLIQPIQNQPMQTQPMQIQPIQPQYMQPQPLQTRSFPNQPIVSQPILAPPISTVPILNQTFPSQTVSAQPTPNHVFPAQNIPTQLSGGITQFPQYSSKIEYSQSSHSQNFPLVPSQLIKTQNYSNSAMSQFSSFSTPSLSVPSQPMTSSAIQQPVAGPMQRPFDSRMARAISPIRYQQRVMDPQQQALVHGWSQGTLTYQPLAHNQLQMPPLVAPIGPPPPMEMSQQRPFTTPTAETTSEKYQRLPAPYHNVWVPPVILPQPEQPIPKPEPYLPEPLIFKPFPEPSAGDFQEPPHIAYCRQLEKFKRRL